MTYAYEYVEKKQQFWHCYCGSIAMRESAFYILMNMKTCQGLESFGRFFMGSNRKFAEMIFSKLQGSSKINDGNMLTLELQETSSGLPMNLHIIACTLEELAQNCKMIAKETFKFINLENS